MTLASFFFGCCLKARMPETCGVFALEYLIGCSAAPPATASDGAQHFAPRFHLRTP